MDCEQARRRLAEDPADLATDVRRHLASCAACAAYAARAAEAERRILAALRFEVAGLDAARHGGRRSRVDSRRTVLAALAAALVAGLAVWLGLGGGSPATRSLAEDVAQHWFEEPEAWTRTDVAVSTVALQAALDGQARLDLVTLGPVTYARLCLVAGQWVPHLVVQGTEGPVMLLLLRGRPLSDPMPLSLPEQRIDGRLLPHGDGSIAVMGEDGEPLDEIGRRAASAVEWTI